VDDFCHSTSGIARDESVTRTAAPVEDRLSGVAPDLALALSVAGDSVAGELAADPETPVARRPGRVRNMPSGWRQVALIGTMSIFGPLCIDMYLPALPGINRELHASASAVQLTLTACLIGMAAGQLVLGPVSDRIGRRRPLLVGLAAFILSSLACAVAPNIYALTGFRLIQGFGGAAGIVMARSIVRDLHSGTALARFYSTLMLATGVGPVFAPQIGSWILSFSSWRGVFAVLAVFGAVLLASAWWRVPETLDPRNRQPGGVLSTLGTMVTVTRDRVYIGCVLACGLGMGGTFAYISGSSFVLQNVYGLSALGYGLVFALNAFGMIIGAQVSGRLIARYGAGPLLTAGLATMIVGGAVLFCVVVGHLAGLAGVIPALWLTMFGFGFVGPNSAALAMQRYPQAAGSAAAVLGSFQFGMAAVIAPLAGAGGPKDAFPMVALVLFLPVAALAARLLLARTGDIAAEV
jgi:DHA1 family bicyclomycin/chloramphenicol resistance-like MFS transporter